MILLALAAIGVAYTTPWADIQMRNADFSERIEVEYGVMEFTTTYNGEADETSYRDDDVADVPGEFLTGFWLVPIGGLLLLGAAMTLLAAPSGGKTAARTGAIIGIVAATVVMVGTVSFLLGFSDVQDDASDIIAQDETWVISGSGIRAGAIWLGAGVVLGLGGSVLGFSDKAAAQRRNPTIPAE